MTASRWKVHPTTLLPILTFLDHFSVALIVPLLQQYFLDSGVTSASQRELLSSLFSTSQIIGALSIGVLSDIGILSERSILLLSFGGSAVAYALIGLGDFWALVWSRILVGLVKQTITVGTSMISRYTAKQDRARYIGRLMSSTTMGFIIGPSMGGYLYRYDTRAPVILASSVFVINFISAAILVPSSIEKTEPTDSDKIPASSSSTSSSSLKATKKYEKFTHFTKNLKLCFSNEDSQQLGGIILSQLLYHFTLRATSYANIPSYYPTLYHHIDQPHHRGYIASYQRCLSFLFQTFFVDFCLNLIRQKQQQKEHKREDSETNSDGENEYKLIIVLSAAGFIISNSIEYIMAIRVSSSYSTYIFLGIVCPLVAIQSAMLNLSLKSLITHAAPKSTLTSVFGVLDVLQNMTSVTVPFYRTFLFRLLGEINDVGSDGGGVSMKGDPSPVLWIVSSFAHWSLATLLFYNLLLKSSDRTEMGGVESNVTGKEEQLEKETKKIQ